MPHYILGLTAFSHDSAACLLQDGKILHFVEEERFNREKHTAQFPKNAIQACLDAAQISAEQIQDLAFFMDPRLEFTSNLKHVLRFLPASLSLLYSKTGGGAGLSPLGRNWKCRRVGTTFAQEFKLSKIPRVHFIEHHLAHASSCFHLSEFPESAILTLDGRGESTTTLLAYGKGLLIQKLMEQKVPHSLGHLYAGVTDYLGFKSFHDEWKVMGMSAYGTDSLLSEFRKIVHLDPQNLFRLDLSFLDLHIRGYPHFFNSKFTKIFGPKRNSKESIEQRHFDLAFALQRVTEEVGVHLAQTLYEKTRCRNLCLTGGVALNVLMNQLILEKTPFDKVFIQPVASDAGTALGAATYVWHSQMKRERKNPFRDVFYGSSFSESEIEMALKEKSLKYERSSQIAQRAADLIAQGQIVGWFQGAMEVGPRALGNRSILADPRSPLMKDKINAMIKQRESFRPFAPSVLREHANEYFDLPKNAESPYMILSARAKFDKASKIAAVVHVDGTARVHTVDRSTNPLYWELIQEFFQKTGVPMVLNTSFNQQEPIVRTPQEAIDCFLRAKLDWLAIGPFLVKQP